MRNKNLIVIHHDDQTNYDQCNNLIDYLHKRNVVLSYVYDNIFNLLKFNQNGMAQNFLKEYKINHQVENAKIKYLSDCFLHEPIKTVFTISESKGVLCRSKGSKKEQACAISNNCLTGIFIISSRPYGTIIQSEDEIYSILKQLDPDATDFKIELHIKKDQVYIHVIENITTLYNWFNIDDNIKSLFPLTKIPVGMPILFLDNAQTSDKTLNVTYMKRRVLDVNGLIEISNRYTKFHIIVAASKPMEITSEYLGFIQCDFYLKKKNRVGIANNLLIYNRYNDGIINKITNPPRPASNGLQLKDVWCE